MAFADTARLAVQLDLKGNFNANLRATQKALTGFDRAVASSGSRAYKAGAQLGAGIRSGAYIAAGAIGFLTSQVGFGLRSLSELESITTQTNAVLKSTKGAAGQTATSIRDLAEQYESLNATIDDKVIQSGENLLLTFTNIRKEAFEPALKAALDMNIALGRGESGLQGTIQTLGVALNDPIRGLTRLQRAGVTFTKVQRDQITAAVKAGDTFKAQGIILAELNKRYGGSFLAGGSTTTGKIAKFKDAIEDLQKALATALLPTLGKVADALSTFLRDKSVIKGVSDLGDSIASMFNEDNLKAAGDILRSVFLTAKAAAPVVVAAAKTMAGIVSTAVNVFRSLPPEIQQLAIGAFAINKLTGGLVTNVAGGIAGGIADFLARKFTGGMNVSAGVVNVNGGVGGVAGAAGGATKGRIASALGAVGKVFLVGAAVGVFAELAGVLNDQSKANKAQAAGLATQTAGFVKVAGIDDVRASLAGIDAEINRLNDGVGAEQIAFGLNIDGVKDAIYATRAALVATITAEEQRAAAIQVRATERVENATTNQKAATDRVRDRIEATRIAVASAGSRTAAAVTTAKERIAAASRYAGQQAAAAIRDKDLSVSVRTNVNVATTVSVSSLNKARTTFKSYGNKYID